VSVTLLEQQLDVSLAEALATCLVQQLVVSLVTSLETSSAVPGALTMVAFGAGTAGPLVALGVFSSVFNRWLGRYSTRIAAVAVMAMGAFLVWRGVMLPGAASCPHHPQ
jgi:sulfite exporter TauE/SafE